MKTYKPGIFLIEDHVTLIPGGEPGVIKCMTELQDGFYEFYVELLDDGGVVKCQVDYPNNKSTIEHNKKYYRSIKLKYLLNNK